MIEKCYWEEGSKQQWTFYANDNSSLDSLSVNGKIYSGNYVGVCRLKSLNGKNITSTDGREVILKIEPRFPVSVVDMLNALRDDNEFERYLAPQTNRINEAYREIEDLKDNELFHFFENEDPIFLKDSIAHESSIITASIFITMLKNLCTRPLMGRMEKRRKILQVKLKVRLFFLRIFRKIHYEAGMIGCIADILNIPRIL